MMLRFTIFPPGGFQCPDLPQPFRRWGRREVPPQQAVWWLKHPRKPRPYKPGPFRP